MIILIVDDSPEKMDRICLVVHECLESTDYQILCAKTNAEAVSYLKLANSIDIIVLDLNLPIRDGEDAKRDAGILLVKEISRNPKLTKPEAIIGLTAFEMIKAESQKLFNSQGWVIITYDPKLTEWEEIIRNKIYYLINKRAKVNTTTNEILNEVSVVIFSALSKEFKAIRSNLEDVKSLLHDRTGTAYEVGNYQGKKIALMETGMGNVISGIEAERALQFFKPNYALFVGVGGGLKDVGIGDVVIGSKIYGYESGKDGERFLARSNFGQTHYVLEQLSRQIARDDNWLQELNKALKGQNAFSNEIRCFVAPIAAGEKVVVSKKSSSYKKIKSYAGDSLAVAMEEYGFLEAAKAHSDIKCAVIRGISDLVDGKQEADQLGSQEFAALTASRFAFELINRIIAASNNSGS